VRTPYVVVYIQNDFLIIMISLEKIAHFVLKLSSESRVDERN
jgi:hypothetical protein